ncbi:unnamed protein product, partial [Polarella glacialis]
MMQAEAGAGSADSAALQPSAGRILSSSSDLAEVSATEIEDSEGGGEDREDREALPDFGGEASPKVQAENVFSDSSSSGSDDEEEVDGPGGGRCVLEGFLLQQRNRAISGRRSLQVARALLGSPLQGLLWRRAFFRLETKRLISWVGDPNNNDIINNNNDNNNNNNNNNNNDNSNNDNNDNNISGAAPLAVVNLSEVVGVAVQGSEVLLRIAAPGYLLPGPSAGPEGGCFRLCGCRSRREPG